jgi:hypothetical protein
VGTDDQTSRTKIEHFNRKQQRSLGHNQFHVPKAQGKMKVKPNALTDDCRWVAVALVRDLGKCAHQLDSNRLAGLELTMPFQEGLPLHLKPNKWRIIHSNRLEGNPHSLKKYFFNCSDKPKVT